jgi:hypothetical protein
MRGHEVRRCQAHLFKCATQLDVSSLKSVVQDACDAPLVVNGEAHTHILFPCAHVTAKTHVRATVLMFGFEYQ